MYKNAVLEIEEFEVTDVITTSEATIDGGIYLDDFIDEGEL